MQHRARSNEASRDFGPLSPEGGAIAAHEERTALYRLYDAEGVLLYIGIAKNPETRWKGHAYSATSTWWPQVARKAVTWFPSREAADEAETLAIQAEKPVYNRAKVLGLYNNWGRRPFSSPEINWLHPHLDSWSDQITRILRAEVSGGKVRPGDPMPTGKELIQRFGVKENTCNLVLRRLADEGIIHQPRKCSRYFCSNPDAPEQSTHVRLSYTPADAEKPDYKVFRFAVNRPAKGAAAIRAKMTNEQWSAFAAAVAEIAATDEAA